MTKQVQFSMNLQLFAENDIPADETIQEEETVEDTKEKRFTRTDIAKMIASEKSKWEKESQQTLEKRLEEERSEAEKKANMDADKRLEYEREQREQKLARREAELTSRELKTQSAIKLKELNLPNELAEFINTTDAIEAEKSISKVQEIWEKANKSWGEALTEKVNDRLKSSVDSPLAANKPDSKIDTSDYQALLNLKRENPEQYNKLMGK